MGTLLTLLHISDLHIGDIDRAHGSLDAVHYEWWRANALFDGFLGHSHRALRHVVERYNALRGHDDSTHVVMTGDLTAMGAPNQLQAGRKFLTQRFEPEPGNSIGLKAPGTIDRSIPGNHDHWPGRWRLHGMPQILGAPTDELAGTFPRAPWKQVLSVELQDRVLHVVLVGINSDDEVWPWGPSRWFARGRFPRQIRLSAELFGPPERDEIRVLLVHHTRHVDGYTTGICEQSRHALEGLVADHDVAVILTGHLHEPRARMIGSCPEVCAGTTTQLDEPPMSWNISDRQMTRFRDNTLCVHRIAETHDGELEWQVTFERRRETGFVPITMPAIAPFRVWPRGQ
jgi:hypothetical protein